jgi:hypothetical protein
MAGPPHRRLLVLFLLFTQAVSVIYTYKDVALPPESVLVSTHGLFGAANGDSAFVNVDLRFEIEARENYLDVAQTMEVFLIKHGAKNAQEYYSCDHKTGRVAIKNGAKSVQDTDSQLEVPVRLVRRTVSKCKILLLCPHSLAHSVLAQMHLFVSRSSRTANTLFSSPVASLQGRG